MTITLLDLYNSAASQEWAMYDNDAISDSEFEDSFVLAINKSIIEILASYDFPFRERTHLILTIPNIDTYDMPNGLIKKHLNGNFAVKHNSSTLNFIENYLELEPKTGIPESFYIKNNKIIVYPIPKEKGLITIDYMT